jgi:hypothetical protein
MGAKNISDLPSGLQQTVLGAKPEHSLVDLGKKMSGDYLGMV